MQTERLWWTKMAITATNGIKTKQYIKPQEAKGKLVSSSIFPNVKDTKYIKLLKEQLYWLNRNPEKLYKKSKTLYDKYVNKTLNYTVLKRCCNFKLLEEKCNEYNLVCAN